MALGNAPTTPLTATELSDAYRQRERFYEGASDAAGNPLSVLDRIKKARKEHEQALEKAKREHAIQSQSVSVENERCDFFLRRTNQLTNLDNELDKARDKYRSSGQPRTLPAFKLGQTPDWLTARAKKAESLVAKGKYGEARNVLTAGIGDMLWRSGAELKEFNKLRDKIDARKEEQRIVDSDNREKERAPRRVCEKMASHIFKVVREPDFREFMNRPEVQAKAQNDPTYRFLRECMDNNLSRRQIENRLMKQAVKGSFNPDFSKLNQIASDIKAEANKDVKAAKEGLEKAQKRIKAVKELEEGVTALRDYEVKEGKKSKADLVSGETNEGVLRRRRYHVTRWTDGDKIMEAAKKVQNADFNPESLDMGQIRDWKNSNELRFADAGIHRAFSAAGREPPRARGVVDDFKNFMRNDFVRTASASPGTGGGGPGGPAGGSPGAAPAGP